MKRRVIINVSAVAVVLAALLLLAGWVGAWPMPRTLLQSAAPTVVSYQGRVTVGGSPYNGTGYFKFAVVDSAGTTSYWSNDDTSAAGSEPTYAVELWVSGGLFNVLLGDTSLTNMTQALSAGVFSGPERYLRVWFSAEGSGFTLLSPDRRIAAVPYALQAEQAADADTVDGMHGAQLEESVEIDDDIATHESFPDAHHARYTDAEAFGAVLDNDGAGSGLDADTVDGMQGADLEESAEIDSLLTTHTATSSAHHARYTDAEAFGAVLDNDGAGSGLDADTVDGMHGSGLEESAEIDADIATHSSVADAHHARYTDAEAFGAVLDNDGAGSGLDADTVDGMQGADLEESAEIDSLLSTHTATSSAHHARYTDAEALAAVLASDGAGSGLDADRLDGQHGAFYQSASNINAGTLSASRFSAYGDLGTEGYLGNAAGDLAQNNGVLQPSLNADMVDGQHGSAFAAAAHDHGNSYWKLSGNAGTDPNTHFLGTSDAVSLTLGVSSTQAVRIDTAGNVGVGADAPTERLTVRGNGLILGDDDPVARGYITDTLDGPQSVYVSGKYAYVVSRNNHRLTIFDVSDADDIVREDYTFTNLDAPESVFVSGKYAYVASHNNDRLAIFDVSAADNIVAKGYTSTNLDGPYWVHVSAKYAYVASGNNNRLAVFDISDPDNIVAKGYTSTNLEGPRSVYVSGKFAYVASGTNHRLAIFDVSDADNIVAKGYTSTNLDWPLAVYVSGKYAYLASSENHRLAIFDISDPDSIWARGYASTGLNRPWSVYVSGKYAYVASLWNDRLAIFDISDPGNIVAKGYTSTDLYGPSSVYVSGKHAYVASYWNNRLAIFELNHLESPTVQTGNLQSGYLDVTDNAIVGNNLYVQGGLNVGPGGALIDGDLGVAGRLRLLNSPFWQLSGNASTNPNTHFLGTSDGVSLTLGVSGTPVVRIDTAGNMGVGTDAPTERLTVRGSGLVLGEDNPVARGYTSTNLDGPFSVYVSGKYAYVAVAENDRLAVFDVSDPDSIAARGYITANLDSPLSVYVSDKYAYLASYGNSRLAIFDVSDAHNIVAKGSTTTNLNGPRCVYVSGKYAYVASGENNRLAIFDVSDPDNIVAKGFTSANLSGPISVYVSGKYAYVASRANDYLAVFDVSDADNIVAKGYTSTNLNYPVCVYVSGKYAYVASSANDRLAIFDVSDPDSLVARGYTSTNLNGARSVYVSGKYAYVASYSNSRLAVFDVSDPDNIVARGYASANLYYPYSVYVSGRYAYVVSYLNDRLVVFELNHLESPTLETGNLQSGYLDVTDNAIVGNNLYVQGGLNVGPGGALIAGDLGVAGHLQLINDGAGSGIDADLLDGLEGAQYQRRITGTCASGNAIRVVNADGTVQCQSVPGSPWEVSGGNVYYLGGSVGIGTETPQSVLQVVGNYIQFPIIFEEPPGEDCDEDLEWGRVVVNVDSGSEFHLYVCTDGGWVGK